MTDTSISILHISLLTFDSAAACSARTARRNVSARTGKNTVIIEDATGANLPRIAMVRAEAE